MKGTIWIVVVVAALLSVGFGAAIVEQPWGGSGWVPCNTAGDYGSWDKVSPCFVAWDPVDGVCSEVIATRLCSGSG